MVLLQTLVMSVILSMIAVMVLKWVLGRYMLSARNYRSAVTKLHTQGYMDRNFATWGFATSTINSTGSSYVDGKLVKYVGNVHTFTTTSDEDQ